MMEFCKSVSVKLTDTPLLSVCVPVLKIWIFFIGLIPFGILTPMIGDFC
ncbi:hypothetical protein [Moraxella lacunata]